MILGGRSVIFCKITLRPPENHTPVHQKSHSWSVISLQVECLNTQPEIQKSRPPVDDDAADDDDDDDGDDDDHNHNDDHDDHTDDHDDCHYVMT